MAKYNRMTPEQIDTAIFRHAIYLVILTFWNTILTMWVLIALFHS